MITPNIPSNLSIFGLTIEKPHHLIELPLRQLFTVPTSATLDGDLLTMCPTISTIQVEIAPPRSSVARRTHSMHATTVFIALHLPHALLYHSVHSTCTHQCFFRHVNRSSNTAQITRQSVFLYHRSTPPDRTSLPDRIPPPWLCTTLVTTSFTSLPTTHRWPSRTLCPVRSTIDRICTSMTLDFSLRCMRNREEVPDVHDHVKTNSSLQSISRNVHNPAVSFPELGANRTLMVFTTGPSAESLST